jgi:type II secretory ATPase GspE/PulE/Tfp pilus assembly ATPase PilB-like protein
VLVTGPTGSGKTTTLYSALSEIKDEETKIITTEDPIEYQLEGINQIQVNHKVGLTFAASLRAILRHDPDVVLVGEIRDYETAENAIQASLTGHLVFSTLHTNDAAGAYMRLVDMGVEPFLVSSTVEGIMAQRLVRTLCPLCKAPIVPTAEEAPEDFPWAELATRKKFIVRSDVASAGTQGTRDGLACTNCCLRTRKFAFWRPSVLLRPRSRNLPFSMECEHSAMTAGLASSRARPRSTKCCA